MTRLLDRIASANGIVTQIANRAAARLLPAITAGTYCWWRCIKTSRCIYYADLEYCDNHPTGRYRCVAYC
jgi:hypothetical protein